jgi:membrane protease YdiL (CAAX protease family)
VRFICYVAGIAAAAVAATILTRLLVPPAPSPWHNLVWIKNLFLPVVLFTLYLLLVRVMEHRTANEIGVRQGLPTLLPGFLIGLGVITSSFLLLLGLGMAQITEGTGLTGLAGAVGVPLVTSMGEELLFRAIIFGILEEVFGSAIAVLVSATLFGLAHAANPGATPFTITALSIELGVMLALAYILTRNIWFPVAIHTAWNFTQAFVFGAYNSGVRDPYSYFRTNLSGPHMFTGGTFGPEGSTLTILLSVGVSTALYVSVRRNHNWQPVRFQPLQGKAIPPVAENV